MKGENRLMLVEWVDSCAGEGWRDDEHADRALRCYSIGRVALDGDEVLVLEANWHPEDTKIGAGEAYCGSIAIPKASILRVADLADLLFAEEPTP